MKKFYLILILLLALGGIFYFSKNETNDPPQVVDRNQNNHENVAEAKDVEVIMQNLEIPWDLAFLPDGQMLVAERPGRLLLISKDKNVQEITIDGVKHVGEGGLLGIVLHPKFSENKLIYLYLSSGYSTNETRNRVERHKLDGNRLIDKKTIVENIPGAIYHDGGRMEFAPDGLLYITTGDATRSFLAQDRSSLAGKILRVRDDGSIPDGNPFKTAVWSYGHRNPQGIAWDDKGNLWETEHGRSGVTSGLDEINLIKGGQNYGWPSIEGDETRAGMTNPILHSGADTTWAPASLVFLNGSLFFGGLRGEALYEAVLDGERIKELKKHFFGEFGRIRTVRIGPDNMLYLTTSNRDGRGKPDGTDDRIIRVNPASLK